MTQEDKELLLKDLSARLQYKLILHFNDNLEEDDQYLYSLRRNGNRVLINDAYYVTELKPYLRPMSSMTEEESDELESITFPLMEKDWDGNENPACIRWVDVPKYMDFILSHHFDYNGLIEKGLAIEAPEGMYN